MSQCQISSVDNVRLQTREHGLRGDEVTVCANGGIRLQLIELYAREPERFAKIRDQLEEVSVLEFVQEQVRAIVADGVDTKAFSSEVPVENVLTFIQASIHGVVNGVVRPNHIAGTPVRRCHGLYRRTCDRG